MKRIGIERGAYEGMYVLEKYMKSTSLDKKLCELIKVRASQINGCAYCLDMHTEEAMGMGETPRRLYAVAAWHESPLFTEQERIALKMTEEITQIGKEGLTDETYNAAIRAFGEQATAQIIMQAVIINSWNRITISGKEEYVSKHDK